MIFYLRVTEASILSLSYRFLWNETERCKSHPMRKKKKEKMCQSGDSAYPATRGQKHIELSRYQLWPVTLSKRFISKIFWSFLQIIQANVVPTLVVLDGFSLPPVSGQAMSVECFSRFSWRWEHIKWFPFAKTRLLFVWHYKIFSKMAQSACEIAPARGMYAWSMTASRVATADEHDPSV